MLPDFTVKTRQHRHMILSDSFAAEDSSLQEKRRADICSQKFNSHQAMSKINPTFAPHIDSTVNFRHRKLMQDTTKMVRFHTVSFTTGINHSY